MIRDGRIYLPNGERFSIEHARKHPDAFKNTPNDVRKALIQNWWWLARDEQLPPSFSDLEWNTWLYLAGRGAGKTRTGAEFCRMLVMNGYRRLGLIGPTASDTRDVMVLGESGLINVCYDDDRTINGDLLGKPIYEPSKRRVIWKIQDSEGLDRGEAIATLYSADEPERLRGPQHDFIWTDELCSWRYPETWDLAMFGLRLGARPLCFVSTTPKPKQLLKDIMSSPTTRISRGTTYDNKANLSESFFKLITKYEGTRLGSQELEANILEESSAALWSRDLIERQRKKEIPSDIYFKRVIVAVDPATSSNKDSDETGIIVCALGSDGNGYILNDSSGIYSPDRWASIAVGLYRQYKCDFIIAESNQGGDMIRHTLQTVDRSVMVNLVRASKGKAARAEPVAALFEQGKVYFVGVFKKLEDQLCQWEPLGDEGSPDRLDALVWGITHLLLVQGVTTVKKVRGYY